MGARSAAPLGWAALALGVCAGLASLFAGTLGLASSAEFGWKNVAGTLIGAGLCALGAVALSRSAPVPLPGVIQRLVAGRRWVGWGAAAGVCSVAAYLDVVLRPNVLVDDAPITFRYVERLSEGRGFTYNDHEHVLGASNPLYTLAITVIHAFGPGIETSARVLDTVLLAASVLVAIDLTRRLSGWAGGLLAGVLLTVDWFYRYHGLDGLEAGLSVFLGLLVASALIRGRYTLAGVFLGLAVWNKLDAGLLAIAVAVAFLVVCRRPPWRIATVSAAVVAPWLIFAWAYFGSPVPHSFTAKLAEGEQATGFDQWWITRFFWTDWRQIVVALALGMIVLAWVQRRERPGEALAVLALGGWAVLHALFYTVVSLGGNYPWYLIVLIPPPIILGSAFVARLGARWRPAAQLALLAAGALLLALPFRGQLIHTRPDLEAEHPVISYEAFDEDRRLAGAWLARYSAPREVIGSPFGWVAFEAPNPVDDTSKLNSEKHLHASYQVSNGDPYNSGSHPPQTPPGLIPLATFNTASEIGPGFSWFTVFGLPGSHAARSGSRYLQYRLFELPDASRLASGAGLRGAHSEGLDLVSAVPSDVPIRVPNRHQPIHVVFTPAVSGPTPAELSVRAGGRTVYERVLPPGQAEPPAIVAIPEAARVAGSTLVFSAAAAGPGAPAPVRWVSVKVIVGDAILDPSAAGPPKLRELWARYNPRPAR